MGESKFDILEKVPDEVKPLTLRMTATTSVEDVLKKINEHRLTLPVIFKPDMGERGWMVRKIKTEQDIRQYLQQIKMDFIIQELVDLPLEYGVFYVRYPSEEKGNVVSVTGKEFLSVTGDGRSTLQQLIFQKDRAVLQWPVLREKYADQLSDVLPSGRSMELVSIGNHCLGTTFLNGQHLITDQMHDSFDRISKKIEGFYFGRYDLRCATVEDLQAGRVKIVELNGCGAEPAHIYHPGFSFWKALRVLIRHWQQMYRVSVENHQRGVPYLSFAEGKRIYHQFQSLQKSH